MLIMFVIVCSIPHLVYGQTQSTQSGTSAITFIEEKPDAALKEAVKKGSYVFVDAYASWCGPCKALKAKVFTDKKVADFFNNHFVNLSINVQKGKGPELAKKWNIQGLPTLLILDAKGNIISQSVGYIDADNLLAFANEALNKKIKFRPH